MPKRLYVISDLHIGGEYSKYGEPGGRGFRLCTHIDMLAKFVNAVAQRGTQEGIDTELVINGDFVDFLAEKTIVTSAEAHKEKTPWRPFIADPGQAVNVLGRIIERDQSFFNALRDLLGVGHRLTVLLGNHDIELSFPAVRRLLTRKLNAEDKRFAFVYDGEAYNVGTVLIEHSNRYDEWNVVTHDALRRMRSGQSRNEPPLDASIQFEAPAGSYLVAGVMNQIKTQYPFIDLLKPENEAAIPILLALAPQYRKHMLIIAALVARSRQHRLGEDGRPIYSGDIASDEDSPGEALMRSILRAKVPAERYQNFMKSIAASVPAGGAETVNTAGDIAGGRVSSVWSQLKLLFAGSAAPVSARLPTLLAALEGTRDDFSFDRTREKEQYLLAARKMVERGFQVIVFGHTHLAKEIALEGGTYINTGTWADLIPFPSTVLQLPSDLTGQSVEQQYAERLRRLGEFVTHMRDSNLNAYIKFLPTYARIVLDDKGEVTSAELCDYQNDGEPV
jgi:UDP-2,3-diacylglucosamine pyrophosphatase LpxH